MISSLILFELVFQVPGRGKGGGETDEVRGMGGRHAGRRLLGEKMDKRKRKSPAKSLKIVRDFKSFRPVKKLGLRSESICLFSSLNT